MMQVVLFILSTSGLCLDMIGCQWIPLEVDSKYYSAMVDKKPFHKISKGCRKHVQKDVIIHTNDEMKALEDKLTDSGIDATFWIRTFKKDGEFYWKDEKIDEGLLSYPAKDTSADQCLNISKSFKEYHDHLNTSTISLPPSCKGSFRYFCKPSQPKAKPIQLFFDVPGEGLVGKDLYVKDTSGRLPTTPMPPTEATTTPVNERVRSTTPIATTRSATTRNFPDQTTVSSSKAWQRDTTVIQQTTTILGPPTMVSEPASLNQSPFPTLSTESHFSSVTSPYVKEKSTQSKSLCQCSCTVIKKDKEDAEKSIHETIEQLQVNVSRLSATVRRHTSVYDPRLSAALLSVPILLLVVTTLSFIVCSDLGHLYRCVNIGSPY